MLGTNNPSNVIIQQGLQKLAQMAHWNYSLVSYDPANPGTFTQAETTALAKHPQYLVEAGLPLTASQLAMAKSAARSGFSTRSTRSPSHRRSSARWTRMPRMP